MQGSVLSELKGARVCVRRAKGCVTPNRHFLLPASVAFHQQRRNDFPPFSSTAIIVPPVPASAPLPAFASHPVTRGSPSVFVCVRPLRRGKRARTGPGVLKRSQTPSQCLWVSGFRPPFSRSCSACAHGPALCHQPHITPSQARSHGALLRG